MKVLHLLQSNRFSGAENVVCQIIGMMKNNSDIDMVYCSPDGPIRESLKEREIKYEPCKDFSVKAVKEVIDKYHPDIIHAHDRSAGVIAALASRKIPIIAHIHVNNNKGMKSFIKNMIWTLFVGKYYRIFWVSDSAYEQFQWKGLVKEKSSVLYNVMDLNALCEKADSDNAAYDYDIVYVGRLSYQKNPERLMKVLHSISENKADVKIAIVGNGEYEEFVTAYVRENKLEENIKYLGYLNNPLKIIKSSKAFVMTSRFEGTPMVALEAQGLGVPVVSTPVDGMKKIIEDGYNGYLSDNDSEIVNRLIEIISQKELHETLNKNSLKYAMKYNDMNKYYAAIAEAYGYK